MGRLYDRSRNEGFGTRHLPPWEKPCGECGVAVTRDTALEHLTTGHGCMFRVEPWMHTKGVPEETFDELLAFIRTLKAKSTPEAPHE